MDYTGDILDRASSIFNLNSAETNDEMQKRKEVSPYYQILVMTFTQSYIICSC
jgi:hypothetical protein